MSSLAETSANRSDDESAQPESSAPGQTPDSTPEEFLQWLLADQRLRWASGNPLAAEQYLAQIISPDTHLNWALELAAGEYAASQAAPSPVPLSDLIRRFPDLASALADKICGTNGTDRFTRRTLRSEDKYGTLWSGKDQQNSQDVNIRFVRSGAVANMAQIQRTCRTLQDKPHPGIVPIVDYRLLPDGTLRIVTSALPMVTLTEHIRTRRLSLRDSARLLMQIAHAVQHLHEHGLTHLALRPDCILIESNFSTPAVDCTPFPQRPEYCSPEQAADEDHRLDERTDLFSLGSVFFELLTGTKPFNGRTPDELRQQIKTAQTRLPSSVQPAIPPALDAICSGTLQRNRSERHLTAADIAHSLQQWLLDTSAPSELPPELPVPRPLHPFDLSSADSFPELLQGPRTVHRLPATIAHWKSLIEEQSADRTFQVALLSGPPGSGKSSFLTAGLLPRLSPNIVSVLIDSSLGNTEQRLLTALRHELSGIRELADEQFPEDLPGLALAIRRNPAAPQMLVVLDHFEHWLQTNPNLAASALVFALRQCRGGKLQAVLMISSDALPAAARLMAELDVRLIEGLNHAIFDMLTVEQATQMLIRWGRLAGRLDRNHQLTSEQQQFIRQALENVQLQGFVPQWQLALLIQVSQNLAWQPQSLSILSDDGQPLSYLLTQTFAELPASSNRKADVRHAAARLLKALLPADREPQGRIALTQQELVQIAGSDFTPLEVQVLLQRLSDQLHLLSHFPTNTNAAQIPTASDAPPASDTLAASDAPAASVTPATSDMPAASDTPDAAAAVPAVSWQLSHDFLIAPLRRWLLHDLSRTRTGRAELLLEKCTARWSSDPHTRSLPDFKTWLKITRHTDPRCWTQTQQQLIKTAEKFHIRRLTLITTLLICALLAGSQLLRRFRTAALARTIVTADSTQLPALLQQADRTGAALDQFLQPHLADKAEIKSSPLLAGPNLAARMALLPRDPEQAEPLATAFLSADLSTLGVLRNRLLLAADVAVPLWTDALLKPARYDSVRFRAALGLAGMPATQSAAQWSPESLQFIAEQLTSTFAEKQPVLRQLLEPIAPLLLPHLQNLYSSPAASALQQTSAAAAIAQYAADDPELLTSLLLIATPAQAELLVPPFAALKHKPAYERLKQPNSGQPSADSNSARQLLALRHARAALTLLAADQHADAVQTLQNASDPDTLTCFAQLSRQWPVTAGDLIICLELNERLRVRPDIIPLSAKENRATQAILLALSRWPFAQMPAAVQSSLPVHLKRLYADDPSAILHSLSGWLLKTWGFHQIVQDVHSTAVPWDPRSSRQWFRVRIPLRGKSNTATDKDDAPHISLTFIVFPPGDYTIGNPSRQVSTTTPFAICDTELPLSVWQHWQQTSQNSAAETALNPVPPDDSVASSLSWSDTTLFCRWLTRKYRGNDESWQCFSPAASATIQLHRQGFRLPTSDEWEIAASSSAAPNLNGEGDPQLLHFYEWFRPAATAVQPPARKPPTPNGLFDCLGNVSEWTLDASQPGFRIHRGSTWTSSPQLYSSLTSPENTAAENVGLRLACTLPDTQRKSGSKK